jgi:hypothetical protein
LHWWIALLAAPAETVVPADGAAGAAGAAALGAAVTVFLTSTTDGCSAGDGLAVASGALGDGVRCGAIEGSVAVVGSVVRSVAGAVVGVSARLVSGAGVVLATGAALDASSAEAPSCMAPHVRRAVTPSSSVPARTAGRRGAQAGRLETGATAWAVT